MTDCCFLTTKANNFRDYINSYGPDDDIKKWLAAFNPLFIKPSVLSFLVPASKLEGGLLKAASKVVEKLTVPDDKKEEVTNKIHRYLTMFCEVCTATS